MPCFVTADTLLHVCKGELDLLRRTLEHERLLPDIEALTHALLDDATIWHYLYYLGNQSIKEAAGRNVAYLSVAHTLLDPAASIPSFVSELVAAEIDRIESADGIQPSGLFPYAEDYTAYVPTGHYTETEALERYFKVMTWYGRMRFMLAPPEAHAGKTRSGFGDAQASRGDAEARLAVLQAALLGRALNQVRVTALTDTHGTPRAHEVWERIYAASSFFTGYRAEHTASDCMNALSKVYSSVFVVADLEDDAKLERFLDATVIAVPERAQVHVEDGDGQLREPPLGEDGLLERDHAARRGAERERLVPRSDALDERNGTRLDARRSAQRLTLHRCIERQ